MGAPKTTTRQTARPKVVLWPDGKKGSRIDISNQVTGFSFSKSLTEPAGQWSLSTLPMQGGRSPGHIGRALDLERLVRPNAVVSIGMDEPGGICLGLVDQCRRTRSLAGPSSNVGYSLTGTDFGKILAQDHIVHASLTVEDSVQFLTDVAAVTGPNHALIQALPGVWGPGSRDAVPTFLGASVQDVIDWLLEAGASVQVPLLAALGGSGKPSEFIRTDGSVATWNDGRVWSEAPHSFNGTLWSFIRQILDEDFYELFLDSQPNRASTNLYPEIPQLFLTVRPKPFDETDCKFLPVKESTGLTWEKLRTRINRRKDHVIPEHEVYSEELGISDADVFSYYQVNSQHELIGNPDGLAEGLFYPAVDLHALTRAGLRAYEGRLSLVAADLVSKQAGELDYDSEIADEVVEFRNRLFNWYRMAEYYESGAVTVAGRDEYRIGDPVMLPWRIPMRGDPPLKGPPPGTRYYCVGTKHEWNRGQPYSCTMRLTRGHNASTIERAKREIAEVGALFGNPNMAAST